MKKKSKYIHKECNNFNYFDIKWYEKVQTTWCVDCSKKYHSFSLQSKGQLISKKDYPELYKAIINLK